jgi:hypothetical protein
VPLKHAVAFQDGAFLFLAQSFKNSVFFTNILALNLRDNAFVILIKKCKIQFFQLYIRKRIRCKTKKLRKKSRFSIKKAMFTFLYFLKVQKAFSASRLNYYKMLLNSDILEFFRDNIQSLSAN